MQDKVLLVDDDQNILTSYKRQLRKQFSVDVAQGGEDALKMMSSNGQYSVVVSDMRMPGINGIQLLSKVKATSPDTVRIIITGYADLPTVVDAINEGNIFRFLSKPCKPETLSNTLSDGIKQYRLIKAEKELLEQTLKGSIKVLMDVLSLVNPEAFGRSSRIKRYVMDIAEKMDFSDMWEVETAAMLSQIGGVILPERTLKKVYKGIRLTEDEQVLYDKHSQIASRLLANIPRMQNVARIVAYQEKNYDGSGIPRDNVKEEQIPIGARILKAALDYDMLESSRLEKTSIVERMKKQKGCYDPIVLKALNELVRGEITIKYISKSLFVSELKEKMIFDEDIRTDRGLLLIARGQEVNQPLIERLKNFTRSSSIREPIKIQVPQTQS